MRILGYLLLFTGGCGCVFNFYLSFLRYPWFKLTGRGDQYRWVSGIPLFCSLFVIAALVLIQEPGWIIVLGWILIGVDTGGLHWFLLCMLFASILPPQCDDDLKKTDSSS